MSNLSIQVAWLGKDRTTATWEPESSLPSQLIADYEAGVLREVHDITHMSCGQTVHTLASKAVVDVPLPKRPRVVDSQHISAPSGYVVDDLLHVYMIHVHKFL